MSKRAWLCAAMAAVLPIMAGQASGQTADQHLSSCIGAGDPAWCEGNRESFEREFPLAMKGDYGSQRNIAFCLREGCDGAVQKNPTLSCAWRIVIVASGDPEVSGGDTDNFSLACGGLDRLQLATSLEQAKSLFRKIYKRDLPDAFGG
jgi:hypothetical protein